MATFTKLPSGKVRAQVRIGGFYRAQTFDLEKNARKWAKEIEQQLKLSTNGDYIDPPKNANFEDLVSVYCSGLMKPDTHLGENARHREVSDDQATSYLYP